MDGARDSKVFGAVDASYQDKYCLYSGDKRWPGDDLSWDLVGISPYLVEMEKGTDLTHFVLTERLVRKLGRVLPVGCVYRDAAEPSSRPPGGAERVQTKDAVPLL